MANKINVYTFCAINYVPGYLQIDFRQWLGDKQDNSLLESEWLKLWQEFMDDRAAKEEAER